MAGGPFDHYLGWALATWLPVATDRAYHVLSLAQRRSEPFDPRGATRHGHGDVDSTEQGFDGALAPDVGGPCGTLGPTKRVSRLRAAGLARGFDWAWCPRSNEAHISRKAAGLASGFDGAWCPMSAVRIEHWV